LGFLRKNMRQIYSETPDFANLRSYVADYQSSFFQKSKTAENRGTRMPL